MSLEPPGYTRTPNEFFDDLLASIDSFAELKVTLAVIRQTAGWQKEEDEISLSRFCKLTGLSRPSVVEGIEKALARGSVTRRPKGQSFAYQLVKNLNQLRDLTSQESLPEVVKELNQSGKESLPEVVKSFNPQKKGKEKEKEKTKESVPDWLDKEAWADWLKYNRERNLTLKPSTVTAQLSKLQVLSEHETQRSIIDRSIERQWRSFFPSRDASNRSSGRDVKKSASLAEELREQRRRALQN